MLTWTCPSFVSAKKFLSITFTNRESGRDESRELLPRVKLDCDCDCGFRADCMPYAAPILALGSDVDVEVEGAVEVGGNALLAGSAKKEEVEAEDVTVGEVAGVGVGVVLVLVAKEAVEDEADMVGVLGTEDMSSTFVRNAGDSCCNNASEGVPSGTEKVKKAVSDHL
jgi:hypothetical protein